MAQIIIANRLTDGLVVFMTADGRWVESIEDGYLIGGQAPDEAEAAHLLRLGRRSELNHQIIGPELIGVEERAGRRTPTSYRDEIRARGPSVRAETG